MEDEKYGVKDKYVGVITVDARHDVIDGATAARVFTLALEHALLIQAGDGAKAEQLLNQTEFKSLNIPRYLERIGVPQEKQPPIGLPKNILQKIALVSFILLRQFSSLIFPIQPTTLELDGDQLEQKRTESDCSPNDIAVATLLHTLGFVGLKNQQGDVQAQMAVDLRGRKNQAGEVVAEATETGNPIGMMDLRIKYDSIENMAKAVKVTRKAYWPKEEGIKEALRRDYGTWTTAILFANYVITIGSALAMTRLEMPEGISIIGLFHEAMLRMPKLPGGGMNPVKTAHMLLLNAFKGTVGVQYCFWPHQLLAAVKAAEESNGLFVIKDVNGKVLTQARAKKIRNHFILRVALALTLFSGVGYYAAKNVMRFTGYSAQ